MKTKMQTGGANPKKKERLTNRSERVMKRAVKNWEFARDVSNSGTTNKGELAAADAMQNKAQRQGERAKKIRAKAEKYQIGGATNAGTDSIKAKAAAAAKAKAMKAMKTTGSKVGKTSTDAAKKYKIGGMVNPNSNVSKQTVPGSRGVKSGVNPSAAASKVARGTVGGTSTAPSKAIPKAQMGAEMSPYSPNYKPHGEPKAGGAKLKKPKAFTRGAVRKFHKMMKKS